MALKWNWKKMSFEEIIKINKWNAVSFLLFVINQRTRKITAWLRKLILFMHFLHCSWKICINLYLRSGIVQHKTTRPIDFGGLDYWWRDIWGMDIWTSFGRNGIDKTEKKYTNVVYERCNSPTNHILRTSNSTLGK